MSGSESALPPPGLGRRLAAISYDTLLLTAILLFAAIPFVLLVHGAPATTPVRFLFQFYLLSIIALFYCGFWVHGGQTLGMRAWRLRLVRAGGGSVGWQQALLRFFAALLSWAALGAGFLWILVDRDRCAWHDRLSGTRLILLPKEN